MLTPDGACKSFQSKLIACIGSAYPRASYILQVYVFLSGNSFDGTFAFKPPAISALSGLGRTISTSIVPDMSGISLRKTRITAVPGIASGKTVSSPPWDMLTPTGAESSEYIIFSPSVSVSCPRGSYAVNE